MVSERVILKSSTLIEGGVHSLPIIVVIRNVSLIINHFWVWTKRGAKKNQGGSGEMGGNIGVDERVNLHES
jgi:hypothetical protein